MTSASAEINEGIDREPIEIKCSIHEQISLKSYPFPNMTDEEYETWKTDLKNQCFCTICGC
jgi:hypothetical protein